MWKSRAKDIAKRFLEKIWDRAVKVADTHLLGKIALVVLTFASFALLFNWKLALILMPILYIHECGHLWAMDVCGMETRGIYFLPFLGAATISRKEYPSHRVGVIVAIMGPFWGFLSTMFFFVPYLFFRHPVFMMVCFWAALINLFNLLPISPLDGGRIVKAIISSISHKAGIVFLILGILATIALTVLYVRFAGLDIFVFFFALMLFAALMELRQVIRGHEMLPKMKWKAIVLSLAAYGLTAFVLWELTDYTMRSPGMVEFMGEFLQ